MYRRRSAVVPALLAAAAAATPAYSQGPDAETLDRVDDTIIERIEASDVPGFAVAVLAGDRIVHARGFGEADGSGRPVTPQTPFLLGSTTKSFTALAVMQLVDGGKVDLDDPVRRWVPELQLAREQEEEITVRQILQHTSGLPPNTAGGPLLKAAADGTPEQAIAELEGKDPVSAPGAEMEYVNANYVLAGLVVERASGEPYGRYVERHIFRPLGMRNSFADPEAARRAGLAAGHRYVFGVTDETGPTLRPALIAAGYLMSSAEDMARYLSVYLNGGVGINGRRVVSRRGIRKLLAPGDAATELGPWADSAESRYAMGWFVGGPWREPAILHPGDAADSSSLIVLLPDADLAAVTLASASSEIPVPGNPFAIPTMERNVIDVLLGEEVKASASVRRFYLAFDIVVALLVGFGMLALARALRVAARRVAPQHRRRSAVGVALRVAGGALVLGVPAAIGFGWRGLAAWHPDLALVVATLGALLLATAGVRLTWLLRTRDGAG